MRPYLRGEEKLMKKFVLPVVCVLAACGQPTSKSNNKSTNGATNGSMNSVTTGETNDQTNGGVSCTFDADCQVGFACEAQLCVPICTGDPGCPAGQVCAEGENTDALVCKPATNNGTNNGTATNNATTGATVGTNSGTNGSGDLLYLARILDTSSGEQSCDVDDPGSDILAVALEDDTGTAIGWGAVVWDEIVFEGNLFTATDHLDGNAPDLNADRCPDDFNSDTVTSLGCEGSIVVEFLDADSQRIALDASAGQQIRVYEYGAQCVTGAATDTYDIDLCSDTAAAASGDEGSCTIQLAVDGSAEYAAPVSGF